MYVMTFLPFCVPAMYVATRAVLSRCCDMSGILLELRRISEDLPLNSSRETLFCSGPCASLFAEYAEKYDDYASSTNSLQISRDARRLRWSPRRQG